MNYADKSDGSENNQMLHHSKCSKYYDDESAGFARNGSASIIYVMFGYDKCCGTQKQSHIAPLPVRMEEHNSKLTLYGMNSLQMLGLSLIFFTIYFLYLRRSNLPRDTMVRLGMTIVMMKLHQSKNYEVLDCVFHIFFCHEIRETIYNNRKNVFSSYS